MYNQNVLSVTEKPSPEQLFTLLDVVRPIHGETRDINKQSFISRELIAYGLDASEPSTQALSGHIDRKTPGRKYELWNFVLRDTFKVNRVYQHTVYSFRWDEQAVYAAQRTNIIGGIAVTRSMSELEEALHNSAIDMDEQAAQLCLWEITGMQAVSSADTEYLEEYVADIVGQHTAIERAMRR